MSSNLQRALITGQDGSYLTEFLLAKGYEVHAIIRRASRFNTQRPDHLDRDPHNGRNIWGAGRSIAGVHRDFT